MEMTKCRCNPDSSFRTKQNIWIAVMEASLAITDCEWEMDQDCEYTKEFQELRERFYELADMLIERANGPSNGFPPTKDELFLKHHVRRLTRIRRKHQIEIFDEVIAEAAKRGQRPWLFVGDMKAPE
jgi:hypothetical protein